MTTRSDHSRDGSAGNVEGDELVFRLHALMPESRANGPGSRMVIWFQGCTLDCPGCFNTLTHPSSNSGLTSVASIVEIIMNAAHRLDGVTITGGEPFQQSEALECLVREIRRKTSLSVLVFSGHTKDEIMRLPLGNDILADVDVLIAGRYIKKLHSGRGLCGSSNQAVHFLSSRYTEKDVVLAPVAEVRISAEGTIQVTGVAPPVICLSTVGGERSQMI